MIGLGYHAEGQSNPHRKRFTLHQAERLRQCDLRKSVVVFIIILYDIQKSQFQNSPVPSFKRRAGSEFLSSNVW